MVSFQAVQLLQKLRRGSIHRLIYRQLWWNRIANGQWRPKLDKRIDRRLVLVRMYLTVTTTRPPPQHQLQFSSLNFRTGLWSGQGSGQLIPQQEYQTQVRVLCLRIPTTHNGTLEQHGNVFPFSQVNKTYLTAVSNNLEGTTKKPVTRQQKRFFQKEEMKLFEGDIENMKIFLSGNSVALVMDY